MSAQRTQERRDKISAGLRQAWARLSEEEREARRAACRQRRPGPATRERMSASAQRRWARLTLAERMAHAHRQSALGQGRKHRLRDREPTSRYLGVSWARGKGKWTARCQHRRRVHCLGYFENEIEAAEAYDRAALQLYGPGARTNFDPAKNAALQPRKLESSEKGRNVNGYPDSSPELRA